MVQAVNDNTVVCTTYQCNEQRQHKAVSYCGITDSGSIQGNAKGQCDQDWIWQNIILEMTEYILSWK